MTTAESLYLNSPTCSFSIRATHFPSTTTNSNYSTSSSKKFSTSSSSTHQQFKQRLPSLPPAVLFITATGVHASFYAHYAKHLAEECNSPSLIFDYRFVGQSFPPLSSTDIVSNDKIIIGESIIDSKERLRKVEEGRRREILKGKEGRECAYDEWVEDTETALSWLINRYKDEGREIVIVCNSVGGHLFALVKPELLNKVSRCLFMGVFSPWHEFFDDPESKRAIFLERDSETKELKYYNGRAHGFGSDLPTAVFNEWSENMNHSSYWGHSLKSQLRLKRCRVEILSIHLMDDLLNEGKVIMTDESLLTIPNSPASRIIIDPKKLGWEEIGHINSFIPKHKSTIWKVMTEYVQFGTCKNEVIEDRRDFRGGIKLNSKVYNNAKL